MKVIGYYMGIIIGTVLGLMMGFILGVVGMFKIEEKERNDKDEWRFKRIL